MKVIILMNRTKEILNYRILRVRSNLYLRVKLNHHQGKTLKVKSR